MRKNRFAILLAAVLVFTAISCTRDDISCGDSFTFIAADQEMRTKADFFSQNTKYSFFAYKVLDGNQDLAEPYIDNAEGTGLAGGEVGFDGSVPSIFAGNTLNFYAVTLGTSASLSGSITKESDRPVLTLSRPMDGQLPDLRRGVLMNQSSVNSGRITVPFRHALSRLRFTIVRQDEEHLNNATLTSLSVVDSESGVYDIVDNTWSLSDDVDTYLVTDQNTSIPPASSVEIASCLVFPHGVSDDNLVIHVTVDVPMNTTLPDAERHLVRDLELDLDAIPGGQGLRPNYEYTVSIALVNNNIKIVMVVPTMYPWMEGETGMSGNELALGQPITFGGVTWADKNLGAESSTYATVEEWDKMRGYYYQFGRNIPYFVLPTNTSGGYSYTFTPTYPQNLTGSHNPRTAPFPLISKYSIQDARDAISNFEKVYPTNSSYLGTGVWKEMGETVSKNGQSYVSHYPLGYFTQAQKNKFPADLPVLPDQWERDGYTWEQLKANQNEIDKYCFVKGTFNESEPWWKSPDNPPETWNDPKTQPCPKGWRVPTREDWASIMPLSKRTGDICFMNVSSVGTTDNQSIRDSYGNNIPVGANNTDFILHKDLLSWHEVGGDRFVDYPGLEEELGDPYGDFRTDYLCVRGDTGKDTFGTLYAIKCKGTASAYRLRWRYIVLSGSTYRAVSYGDKYPVILEICRYPATSEDVLEEPSDIDEFSDWDFPSERMVFPVSGYVYPAYTPAITNAAMESLYASSTIGDNGYYYYVRMKHSTNTGSRYLMLFKMRRSYGMSIRCVKDNTVVIE